MFKPGKAAVKRWATALLLAALGIAGSASATFIDQGNGVILDTMTNLEWEKNANHGTFNWAEAIIYANSLSLDGGGFHLASDDELLGLFNNLLAAGLCTGSDCQGDWGGFTGIQADYWSSTEYVRDPDLAFDFGFVSALHSLVSKDFQLSAWAVRVGDVDAPPSMLLFGTGMLWLGFSRLRIGLRR
jgi:hypothetical protein